MDVFEAAFLLFSTCVEKSVVQVLGLVEAERSLETTPADQIAGLARFRECFDLWRTQATCLPLIVMFFFRASFFAAPQALQRLLDRMFRLWRDKPAEGRA